MKQRGIEASVSCITEPANVLSILCILSALKPFFSGTVVALDLKLHLSPGTESVGVSIRSAC